MVTESSPKRSHPQPPPFASKARTMHITKAWADFDAAVYATEE